MTRDASSTPLPVGPAAAPLGGLGPAVSPAPIPPTPPLPGVRVCEVGPRDGLQSVATVMATADKCRWIDALVAAGVREIEVASFVPARLLPQMADAADVVRHARRHAGLTVVALVPNRQGAQAALAAGAHKLTLPVSVSAAHSLANVRKTPEAMVDEVRQVVALCRDQAPGVSVEVGLSTAFGCTRQGAVPLDDVLRLAHALAEAGVHEVGLSDTTGMAHPAQVRQWFLRLRAELGPLAGAAHLHNTRGLGLANALAAYDVGVRSFDASLAGLGGCPYAPGASGNVVTEDLVFLFESMGVSTGIDLPRLLAARAPLAQGLPQEPLYGMLAGAGLPNTWVDGRLATAACTAGPTTGGAALPAAGPGAVPVVANEPTKDEHGEGARPHTDPSRPGEADNAVAAPSLGAAVAADAPAALPLAGLRVLEFTHMVMGPACGLVLADLGADVIKVESDGEGRRGDATRHLLGSGAGFFPLFNRNKRSVALDLSTPQGLARARALAAEADVVIENFKPGAMERMGLGPEALRSLNPRLVVVSLKGFLPGPYEHRTALDEVVQMMGGLAHMTGRPGDPLRAGASVNDIMGGVFGALAALAALAQRDRPGPAHGQGQHVQSGLFENNVFLVAQHMMQFAVTGQPAAPMPARVSAWGIYDVFQVAQNEPIFLAVVSDGQWAACCQALGWSDWAQDDHRQYIPFHRIWSLLPQLEILLQL